MKNMKNMKNIRRVLMAPPVEFKVAHYLQNAHMEMGREVQPNLATKQWTNLYNILTDKLNVQVILIPPNIGLYDMVFTANGALIKNNKALISNFKVPARKLETEPFYNFLLNLGYNCKVAKFEFEGQGDALWSHNNNILWTGHGFRTDPKSHDEICDFFDLRNYVIFDNYSYTFKENKNIEATCFPIRLINPKFYHLDTCLVPTEHNNEVLFYPKAFTNKGCDRIKEIFKKENCIEIEDEDAHNFACNAISFENNLILNKITTKLKNKLVDRGYNIFENDMSEFLLSGGSTKCCILHLN